MFPSLSLMWWRKRRDVCELTALELMRRFCEISTEAETLGRKRKKVARYVKKMSEMKKVRMAVMQRYMPVISPSLDMVFGARNFPKATILYAFQQDMESVCKSETGVENFQCLLWSSFESRLEEMIVADGAAPPDNFRKLKALFMVRLFVDELEAGSREVLEKCLYGGAYCREEFMGMLAAVTQFEVGRKFRNALEKLHERFANCLDNRLKTRTCGTIPSSLVSEIDSSRDPNRTNRYVTDLPLL